MLKFLQKETKSRVGTKCQQKILKQHEQVRYLKFKTGPHHLHKIIQVRKSGTCEFKLRSLNIQEDKQFHELKNLFLN